MGPGVARGLALCLNGLVRSCYRVAMAFVEGY